MGEKNRRQNTTSSVFLSFSLLSDLHAFLVTKMSVSESRWSADIKVASQNSLKTSPDSNLCTF